MGRACTGFDGYQTRKPAGRNQADGSNCGHAGRQERFCDPQVAPAMAHKRDNLEE
jgi:hypothetical protein